MSAPVHKAARASRARPVALVLLAGVASVALAVSALREWQAVRAAHPRFEGTLQIEGPSAPLVLYRDRRGIPHVDAESERDAYFGLGFAHAQDRPSQMIWLVRTARGRLAEIAGERALPADRRARLLGIGRHADAAFERMPRSSRSLLAAYAAGVNAQLARLGGEAGTPRAMEGWGAPVEPWQPADSIAIVKLLAWAMGGALDESLVLSDLIEHLGGTDSRLFFPRGVGSGAIPADAGLPVEARGGEAALPEVGLGFPRAARAEASRLPLRRQVGLLGASAGSTSWLVSGRHSASGGTLLAAEAHFAPTLPAAYYEAHIRGGGVDVAGATVPGVPAFWIGFNRRVAWTSTHAAAVVTDLYIESLHPKDPPRYHDGRRWRSLRERVEEIAVRGGGVERLTVRETRHGPLVNAILESEREPLALRWTGAEPSEGIHALLALARAGSAEELRRALADHHEPVLNVLYADAEGEAGLQMAGYVPQRRQAASLLPAPGRDAAYAWEGRVPPGQRPARALAAEEERGRGFLVVADAASESEEGAAIEWLWRPGVRAARAEGLLAQKARVGSLDLRDLAVMQLDVVSERGGALVDAALAVDGAGGDDNEAVAILRDWDHRTAPDSVGAAVYHLFLDRLLRELFAERLGEEVLERYLGLGRISPTALAERAVSGAPGPWSDRERVRAAVQRSLRDVGYRLPVELGANRKKWVWGRLHVLRFEPLWGGGEALGPYAYGGDEGSLLAAEYRPLHSFVPQIVPSYRLLVDTAALDEALTSLAPGQSEHPGHPHRDDGVSRWLAGRPALLATSPLAVEDGAVAALRLEPLPEPSQ